MGEMLKSNINLLDSIPAAFLCTDIYSKILYSNRQVEPFFGYTREELEGHRIRVLFLEEDLTYFLPNIIYLTRFKNGFDGEVLLKQKDGGKIFVHLSTASFNEGGESFLAFAFKEIQQLKKLEWEKLEIQHWATVGRMVAEIAHQFRNPIASIGGHVNLLGKRLPSSPKSRSYMDQIMQEVKKLERILKQVEEYISIPRPSFRKEKIQEMIETTLQDFSKEAMARGASIHLDTEEFNGDGQFYIDRELILKAFSRILENSLEAIASDSQGEKRKRLDVALFDDGENVGASISDRGQGIAKKNLTLIFDPFFSTQPDHVGLGLTIARRVIEEQGGKIRVMSRSGKGTTVTLSFPKDRRRKIRREWISTEVLQKADY